MKHQQIQKDADTFIALPRSERVKNRSKLSEEVLERVRYKQDRNRGISHRERGKTIVFFKEKYIEHACRFQRKLFDLNPDSIRHKNLTKRIDRLGQKCYLSMVRKLVQKWIEN